jgi:hypothetical protein
MSLCNNLSAESAIVGPISSYTYTGDRLPSLERIVFTEVQKIDEIQTAKSLFTDAIQAIFPPSHVSYAFLTGGFVLGTSSNDIDIVVVLRRDRLTAYDMAQYQNIACRFSEEYLTIHQKLGYLPDLDFPSDILTDVQIENAIEGRGFDLMNQKLALRSISDNDGFLDEKIDYRVWLWELLTTSEGFITGSYEDFRRDRLKAIETITLFALCSSDPITSDVALLQRMVLVTGLDERYLTPRSDVWSLFTDVLTTLERRHALMYDQHPGAIIASTQWMHSWEAARIEKLTTHVWDGTLLFGSWENLRQHVHRLNSNAGA